MTDKQKTSLLQKLKTANGKITKGQRAGIFETASYFMTKDTFYKIISGQFVAENNINYAKSILLGMNKHIRKNKKLLKQF